MMSDLSNTLRNMKFMQRTLESRKKSLKKPSATTSQTLPSPPSVNVLIITPDHPGCWRIIKNELTPTPQIPTTNSNHPSITYHNSVFSIHDRNYTRLSFQNYNKRIEPLMIKYGLKQDVNPLEDGEIDTDDDADDENKTKSMNEDDLPKHATTLGKTMRKKFNKKQFTRLQFDNKSRITKRKRRTRARTSTD